ncbi:MAG: NAD-dependent epimerase/dehydratase family protein [Deltaproteobacteria bacterium]|nr:NAD-dependent epimerase/dehydratase family protein [Deltaproteobacteria bacterium]
MKVLVTGGCGFLGSHLCEFFVQRGDAVVCLDNMTKYELKRTGYATAEARQYNWDILARMGVQMIREDIRNYEAVMDYSAGCDYIAHTAAQPAMTISWEDPALDFSTNVQGTFNVLDCARRRRIPIASCATIHVYGNKINETLRETRTRYTREPEAIDESHPTMEGNLSPLHASKMAGDLYVRTYADTYGVEAASFRLTGLYGPRQFGGEDHGWVANFSIRAVMDRPLTIFGTGKQVRDILYAQDVCWAFQAFYKKRVPGVYNIGGGPAHAISLLECIDMIREICGKDIDVKFEPDRYGDLRYFVCDINKARQMLNWRPAVPPRQGVEKLIDWIREERHLFRIT